MKQHELIKHFFIRVLLFPPFFGLITILPAGSFQFWEPYLYAAVVLLYTAFIFVYFLKRDPDFLERRLKMKEKERAQQFYIASSALLLVAGYVLTGFDARWAWSDMPIFWVLMGNSLVLIGFWIIFKVFQQNHFAARTIEVEAEQPVISTGLYSVLRHPMYAGATLIFLATPLALGSFWAFIPFGLVCGLLMLRALHEEQVLLRDLPGYRAYYERVRYRFLPGVW